MPPSLRLLVMPLIGLVCIAAAYLWSRQPLELVFTGEIAEGHIVGMALDRGTHHDIVAGIDTVTVLELANGERIESWHHNYEYAAPPAAATDAGGSLAPGPGDALRVGPPLAQTIAELVRGDAATARRILLRETRRKPDAQRIVRIVKRETVFGHFGVPRTSSFALDAAGRPQPVPTAAEPPGQEGIIETRAVFDARILLDETATRRELMVEYRSTFNGREQLGAAKDFFLFAQPYTTEFRPIFAFRAGENRLAQLSHLGRQGGQTLALRLFQPCRVYFTPDHPERALVAALPGPVAGNPLEWFSRACESLLSQWAATTLLVLLGGLFLVTGLVFISLQIFPSRRHAAAVAPPVVRRGTHR